VTEGFGFNITTETMPLVSFAYATRAEAEAAGRAAFICSTNPIKRPTIGAEAAG
jgi:hypothetical protein